MGARSRLRPAETDPLDEYGLPSKGEKRLLPFQKQEAFYLLITSRFLAFCTEAGDRDELRRQFAEQSVQSVQSVRANPVALTNVTNVINTNTTHTTTTRPNLAITSAIRSENSTLSSNRSSSTSTATSSTLPRSRPTDLSQILSAVRKLREAIVASKRRDDFAIQAYLFAIRLGILASTPETYYPALLYLLRVLHQPNQRPHPPQHEQDPTGNGHGNTKARINEASSNGVLTRVELAEAAGYLVLDAACRRKDLAEAYATRGRYALRDAKVDEVLRALAMDDWVRWRRVRASADGYKARLMEFAEPGMRAHVLKAFGRAYLSVQRDFLEQQAMAGWEKLKSEHGVGWEVDASGRVMIRKIHRRS